MRDELAKIIEEKIWERHDGCEYAKNDFKSIPDICCYKHCAKFLESLIQTKVREGRIRAIIEYESKRETDESVYYDDLNKVKIFKYKEMLGNKLKSEDKKGE